MRWIAIVGAAWLSACGASHQGFHPAERATAETITGETAADYEIILETGSAGDVKLWSRGAFESDEDQTIIHLGVDVDNESSRSIVLDTVELDVLGDDGSVQSDLSPDGRLAEVPPESSGQVDLYFTLPRTVEPYEVRAFRVRWQARAGEMTYKQTTPFVRDREPVRGGPYHYYHSPLYDPFYHPFYDPYRIRYHPIPPPPVR